MGLAIEREEWLCVKLCDPPFLWSSTIKRPLAQLLLANLLISCSSSGRSVQIPKGNWLDMSRSCNFRSLLWTQGSTRGHPKVPMGRPGQGRDDSILDVREPGIAPGGFRLGPERVWHGAAGRRRNPQTHGQRNGVCGRAPFGSFCSHARAASDGLVLVKEMTQFPYWGP